MIDKETFDRYTAALTDAQHMGAAAVEVLDARRLLLTRDREHSIRVEVLDDMLRRLDRQTANKLMSFYHGRTDGTPAEMFEAMKLWLEAVTRNLANRTLVDL